MIIHHERLRPVSAKPIKWCIECGRAYPVYPSDYETSKRCNSCKDAAAARRDVRNARIIELWNEYPGWTTRLIAERVQQETGERVTRNIVIGVMDRNRNRDKRRREKREHYWRQQALRQEARETARKPQVDGLLLADLEPHQCRWPSGEGPYTFCGKVQTDGSSYCEGHELLSREPGTKTHKKNRNISPIRRARW